MIAIGVFSVLYVFVSVLISGDDDENALDLMRVNIADIKPGTEKANNALRSNQPEWFIAIALGTGYGCPIEVKGDLIVETCQGSRFDLAGRVFSGDYADKNLAVPRYSLSDDGFLLLGR